MLKLPTERQYSYPGRLAYYFKYATILLGGCALAPLAVAQTAVALTPPQVPAPDQNGVDLVTTAFGFDTSELSLGDPSGAGIAHNRHWSNNFWSHDYAVYIVAIPYALVVTIGNRSYQFVNYPPAPYTGKFKDGTSLAYTGGHYIFTDRDGTIINFTNATGSSTLGYYTTGMVVAVANNIVSPNGAVTNFTYESSAYSGTPYYRLISVNNSYGYQLKYEYPAAAVNSPAWSRFSKVTAINNAIDYCNPAASSCTGLTQSWPTATYSNVTSGSNVYEYATDAMGRTTTYTHSNTDPFSYYITAIRHPGSSFDNITLAYSSGGYGVIYNGANGTWKYNLNATQTSGYYSNLIYGPDGSLNRTVTHDYGFGLVLFDQDALGRTTSFTEDTGGRINQVTRPEGDSDQYVYDARGNITQLTRVPKAGSGLANIVMSAVYDASCTNAKTCNQPTSVTDERGQMTDYVYDGGTGLLTSATLPAPASGAARPQVRYTYGQLQAQVKNSSGVLQATGQPVWLSSTVSQCLSGSSCAGTAQEQLTWFSNYDNNLRNTGIQVKAGDNSLSATTGKGYDNIGNVTSTTDALGKVTYAGYNADRERIWLLSPDPDDGGALRNRMIYVAYNGDGTVQTVQQGTANADSSGFSLLQYTAYGYDGYGRKTSEALVGGGTTFALKQYSYDGFGRPDCTAQRMNPATYGALPGACDQADAADRITRNEYDAVDHVTKAWEGYRSGYARATQHSYTANGKQATLTDAKGNVTTYGYDGFDRLQTTTYPNPAGGDYEQLTYGTGTTTNLVTSRRLRDGNSVAYTYDNLARVTRMTPPAYTGNDVPLAYAYDNLDHLTQTTDTVNAHNTVYGYDALGRMTVETGPWRTKSMGYDAAGRMTSLDYGDGFHVTYSYDTLGEMTGVWENGSTLLASYGYDDLGNRTSIFNRPNGVVTSYGYDAASRLTSLSNDLAGSASDLTIGLSYNAAGQISQRTSSNDAYAWTDGYNVNRGYTTNGLNQYTSIASAGTITPTYDGRGNTTGAGGLTYGYTALNQLSGASSGAWFYYDAGGRLDMDVGTLGCALLDNWGDKIDAELDCSTGATLRRYVYGADNTPLVWYEGTGDRRWLITDERGSVIAVTDGSGSAMRINAYDEYGIPGANNLGRFGYTGQAWLPSIGMYYARARIYSPTLGRFMQTDPIKYGDGPNWYNYVHGDPVNEEDPTGLQDCVGAELCVTGLLYGGPKALANGINVPAFSLSAYASSYSNFGMPSLNAKPKKGGQLASTPGIGHNGPPPELVEGDIVVTATARIIARGVSVFVIRGSILLSLIIPTDSAGESEEVLRNLAAYNNRGHKAMTLANPARDYDISQGVKNTLDAQKTRATWFDVVKRFLHAIAGE